MRTFKEANTSQALLFDTAGLARWAPSPAEEVPTGGNLGFPLNADWLKGTLLLFTREKGLAEAQMDEIVCRIQGFYLSLSNPGDLEQVMKGLINESA